jgi:uncharacterized protein YabN with tetrapyrrole methylase and pyrophosphatase domain
VIQKSSEDAQRDALLDSKRRQDAVSATGFDWPDISGVLDKVVEELEEIRQAVAAGDAEHARKELGDLLLIAVNVARFLDADPAKELRLATDRLCGRVEKVRALCSERGIDMPGCTLCELDALWKEVKDQEGTRT